MTFSSHLLSIVITVLDLRHVDVLLRFGLSLRKKSRPAGPFPILEPSEFLLSSRTTYEWFWSSKIVKRSVGRSAI